jgi:hypothetical protein
LPAGIWLVPQSAVGMLVIILYIYDISYIICYIYHYVYMYMYIYVYGKFSPVSVIEIIKRPPGTQTFEIACVPRTLDPIPGPLSPDPYPQTLIPGPYYLSECGD